jgi:N,N'-diacetyllegionaminate synthase
MNQATTIIAEAGVNHNGDLELARQLIDAAASAGADAVKFQTFRAEDLVVPDARKADYQTEHTQADQSQLDMLKQLELSEQDHRVLVEHSQAKGIRFLSTGFDIPAVDFLVGLGVDRLKVPSGEITNYPLLQHIGGLSLPVILSTGMADLQEIRDALAILTGAGLDKGQVTVLHCTTAYPTPYADVNLRAMMLMREELDVAVGYSDHTPGIEVATAAVALGATIIEKHFTLDRSLPGPDHQASLEPEELGALVRSIRNVEAALGEARKIVTPSEEKNKAVARKSIVASRAIRAGEIFSPSNLTVKRPGTGLSPMEWPKIIGTKASRDFQINEAIE